MECRLAATVVAMFLITIIMAIQALPPKDLEGQIKETNSSKVYSINCSINSTAFDPISTHGAIAIDNGQWQDTYACIAHCRVESGSSLANLFHAGKFKMDPSGTKLIETQNNETTYPFVSICYDGFYVRVPKKIYEEILMKAKVFRRNSIEVDVSFQREQLYDFVMYPNPWIEVNLSNGIIMNMKLKTVFKLDDRVVPYIVLMENKTGSYYREAFIDLSTPLPISVDDKNNGTIRVGKYYPHEYTGYIVGLILMAALLVIAIVIICIYCLCPDILKKNKVQTWINNHCSPCSNYDPTPGQADKSDDRL